MLPGALIDVSGGWEISASGKVTGGNAGNVAFQGPSLIVNGALLGLSLVGNKGGSISMTAPNITIAASPGALPAGFTADSTLPQNLLGQLVLGANQLDESGFTSITLKSVNDIVMQSGTLGPSLTKLADAGAGKRRSNACSGGFVSQRLPIRGPSSSRRTRSARVRLP